MDFKLYLWKHNLYNLICRNLTDYESEEYENTNWEKVFYDLLVDIVNNWDIIITEG